MATRGENRQFQRRQLRRQFKRSNVGHESMFAGRRNYGQGQLKHEEIEMPEPHKCDPEDRFIIYDARNIPCGHACYICEAEKIAKYRPEVMNDPNYECDEFIEDDY